MHKFDETLFVGFIIRYRIYIRYNLMLCYSIRASTILRQYNTMTSNNNKNDKLASLLKSMSGGDDCDRPACDDTKSALSAALQRVGNNKNVDGASSSSSISKKQQTENEEMNIQKNRYTACPPTRDEIGSSTWSLLHSMVCRYLHTCTLPFLSISTIHCS